MHYSQFIGGDFRQGSADRLMRVINPANGELLGEYSRASPGDVEQAVTVAAEAFAGWRRTSAAERASLLRRAGLLIRERTEQFARQI